MELQTDISTRYLGLELSSPVVASAGPLTGTVDGARRAARAGAGAIVLPSLFEEDLVARAEQVDGFLGIGLGGSPEAVGGYVVEPASFDHGPDAHLALLEEIREAVDIPVIASLNGDTPGGWTDYARMLEDAGADALELNVYEVAADPSVSGAEVERRHIELISQVRATTSLPLAVKLGPAYSSFGHFAMQVVDAGADGLVLFNRFYQPDIDPSDRRVHPRLTLSTAEELRQPVRWIGLLHGRIGCSLAATSGVHDGLDVAKALLAGADVAMTTSALLHHGPGHIATMIAQLRSWMAEVDLGSAREVIGSAGHLRGADPAAYERANYQQVLHSWSGVGNLMPD